MVIYYIGHVYLRPYIYSFCQIFQSLCLFPALRLFRMLEYYNRVLVSHGTTGAYLKGYFGTCNFKILTRALKKYMTFSNVAFILHYANVKTKLYFIQLFDRSFRDTMNNSICKS